MEEAPARDLFKAALHPYTKLLYSSVAGSGRAGNAPSGGEVSVPSDKIAGCAFAARCPLADARCLAVRPAMRELAPGHRVRCFKA
jgi:oligopeptide/dipeptide ABC transporter ATP-binding protein